MSGGNVKCYHSDAIEAQQITGNVMEICKKMFAHCCESGWEKI